MTRHAHREQQPLHLRLVQGDGGTSRDRHERGRVPPNDLAGERVILAGMMTSKAQRATASYMLKPESFYGDNHRLIFEAIRSLDDAGTFDSSDDVPVVLVAGWLRDRELIERAGRVAYLGELVGEVPMVVQFEEVCVRVVNLARLRRAVSALQRAAAEGYGTDAARDPERFLQVALQALEAIVDDTPAAEIATAEDACIEEVAHVTKAHADDGHALRGLRLPLRELHIKTGGIFLGESTCITAATGGGKTLLAGTVAEFIAEHSMYAAGIWSLEMPKRQLVSRMALARSRVNAYAYRGGRLNDVDLAAYNLALQKIRDLPLFFDEHVPRRGWRTIESILSSLHRYAARVPEKLGKPLGLMVLDFMQKVDCSGLAPKKSREYQLNIASDMLVRALERLNVAGIILCQTNEDGQIRESKAVAHHCHGWWKLEIGKNRAGEHTGTVRLGKARHGGKGIVSFPFDAPCVRFHD